MRQIKFRGKRLDNQEWVYGGISIFEGEATIYDENDMTNSAYDVDINTVGEFTNVDDDSGHEIFEGDIINFGAQLGSKSQVKFLKKNAGFLVKDKWGDWQWLYDVAASTTCRLIGNIHDNPKLLE